MAWSFADIPDQKGRIFLITGANSGLGFESAQALAASGAELLLACRNTAKGDEACARIRAKTPGASLTVIPLDLGDQASIAAAAAAVGARGGVDVLLNNAGIMAVPQGRTKDGFELQFGTNHLGHFALTGRLWPHIRDRVVTVSSAVARAGWMDFDNLQWERSYRRWPAYARSKLANLLFSVELARRLAAAGVAQRSLAAHPGYAATGLQGASTDLSGSMLEGLVMGLGNGLVAQSAAAGALPQLYAATAPPAENGAFYGPRVLGMWGAPARETPPATARDEAHGRQLWERSEALTGVRFLS